MFEAKRYLKSIEFIRQKIATLEAEIAEIEESGVYHPLKGVVYDRVVVQTSPSADGELNSIIKLADLSEKLKEQKVKLILEIDRIREEIWALPTDAHVTLLSIVYIEGQSLYEAADRMNRSYDYVKHLHGDALVAFQNFVLEPRKKVEYVDSED